MKYSIVFIVTRSNIITPDLFSIFHNIALNTDSSVTNSKITVDLYTLPLTTF